MGEYINGTFSLRFPSGLHAPTPMASAAAITSQLVKEAHERAQDVYPIQSVEQREGIYVRLQVDKSCTGTSRSRAVDRETFGKLVKHHRTTGIHRSRTQTWLGNHLGQSDSTAAKNLVSQVERGLRSWE